MKIIKMLTILILLSVASMFIFWQPKQTSLQKQIIGEWRNQYLKVNMPTYNNTDKSVLTEADTSNWEVKLRIKPIRTYFNANGTYYSEYRNLKDSLVRKPSGTWSIKADSITMTQLIPSAHVLTLKVSITKNLATFSGVIDFDGDGKADDVYYGIQKKFK